MYDFCYNYAVMVISSVLFTIGGAVMNAVAFSDTNILFNNLMNRTQKT